MLCGEGHKAQPTLQYTAVFITLIGIETITFIDRDNQRAATFDNVTQQRHILIGQSIPGIDNHDNHLRSFNGFQRLDDTELLDRLLHLATPANTGGIDQRIRFATAFEWHRYGIARSAGLIEGHYPVFPGQPIYQSGLTHIGATDDGNHGPGSSCFNRYLLLGIGCQYLVEQYTRALAMSCSNQAHMLEPERKEFRLRLLRTKTIDLVNHHLTGFSGFTHQVGNQAVTTGETILGIDQKQNLIRLFHGKTCLLCHELIQVLLFAAEPTCINNNKGFAIALTDAVLTITGQTRLIRDYGIASARKHIEQRGFTNVGAPDQRNDRDHGRYDTELTKPNLSCVITDSPQISGCTKLRSLEGRIRPSNLPSDLPNQCRYPS